MTIPARTIAVLSISTALSLLAGCYAGNASPYNEAGTGNAGSGVFPSADGTPCPVADMLAQYCVRCHSGSSVSASTVTLTSYANLTAASGSGTVAQKALAKLRDSNRPMPPRGEPAPNAQQVQALADWIAGGYVRGMCSGTTLDGGSIPNPYDTPTVCTSGTHWTSGNQESPKMQPGRACISCHARGEGPRFDFAGTLYPSAHEPNDCNGAPLDTHVIITDANGTQLVLMPNSVGNFSAGRSGLVMPYTVRLERGTHVREMVAAQSTGDCNGCHTETGDKRAPGRIMAP